MQRYLVSNVQDYCWWPSSKGIRSAMFRIVVDGHLAKVVLVISNAQDHCWWASSEGIWSAIFRIIVGGHPAKVFGQQSIKVHWWATLPILDDHQPFSGIIPLMFYFHNQTTITFFHQLNVASKSIGTLESYKTNKWLTLVSVELVLKLIISRPFNRFWIN